MMRATLCIAVLAIAGLAGAQSPKDDLGVPPPPLAKTRRIKPSILDDDTPTRPVGPKPGAGMSRAEMARFQERLLRFHVEYQKFLRTLRGCENLATTADPGACDGRKSRFDAKQWDRLRKEAHRVFD